MVEFSTKRMLWPLLGLLIVQLFSGIVLMPLRSFISIYLHEVMTYPVRQVAQIMALGQIVGMAASLVGGSMSDQWGHKWVLVLGVGGIAVSGLLYAVRAPWLVVVLWGLYSVGMGFSALGSQGYLTLAASAGALGLSSALYNWGYTLGGAVGAPLAAAILGRDNFSTLGMALAGLGFCTTLIAGFLPHLRLPASLRETTSVPHGYIALLRHRRIVILGMLRFLPTCYYGLMALFPLLIKQQGGDNRAVAWYVTGSSMFASFAQLIAGRAADLWGVRLPTVIAFSAIMAAIGGTIITAQSVWGLYIFGALGIGAAWTLSTLLPGMVTRAAVPKTHGRVFGMLHMLWIFAMILGTLLGGALLEIDVRLPFVIVGVLNGIALLLTVPFFRLPKRSGTVNAQ